MPVICKEISVTAGMVVLILTDIVGIIVLNGLLITLLAVNGMLLDYLILLLVVDRVTGFCHQAVSRLAHNDAWFQHSYFVPNQIANTRTVKGPWLVSCLLNNLNYHQAHHAFPKLPYYKLPIATEIIRNCRNQVIPELHWDEVENYWEVLKNPKSNKQYIISSND